MDNSDDWITDNNKCIQIIGTGIKINNYKVIDYIGKGVFSNVFTVFDKKNKKK